jgi:hypothetical protein
MPRSSEWYLPFRFSNQNTACISHLPHACYMSSCHLHWSDYINNI